MHTIKVSTTISTGHRLPSYKGICSSPHGHNVTIDVEISVEEGVFLDFKTVQEDLLSIVQDFDHAMVLHKDDGFLPALQAFGFRHVILSVEPTTENIAYYVFNELYVDYSTLKSVTIHETAKYSATVTEPSKNVMRLKS